MEKKQYRNLEENGDSISSKNHYYIICFSGYIGFYRCTVKFWANSIGKLSSLLRFRILFFLFLILSVLCSCTAVRHKNSCLLYISFYTAKTILRHGLSRKDTLGSLLQWTTFLCSQRGYWY